MARGPKKHLKRINTPRSWLLSKMGGIYATRPSQGPHKLRECLPLSIIIRFILIYSERSSCSPKTHVKSPSSQWTRKLDSRSTTKSEEIANSPLELWIPSPSSRQTRATASSMMSRVDSPSSRSKMPKPSSSSAKSRPRLLAPIKFPTLSPTTPGPSDSPTPKSKKETPSSTTSKRDKSTPGIKTNQESSATLLVVTTLVESEPLCTSSVISAHSTSLTSVTPMEKPSPLVTETSSLLETRRVKLPSPKAMVFT